MAHEGKPLTGADVQELIRDTRAKGKLTLKILADGTLVPVMTEGKADEETKVKAPDHVDKLIDDMCSDNMDLAIATQSLLKQNSQLNDAVLLRLAHNGDAKRKLGAAMDRNRDALTKLVATFASATKSGGDK